jgi:hypothetical protein
VQGRLGSLTWQSYERTHHVVAKLALRQQDHLIRTPQQFITDESLPFGRAMSQNSLKDIARVAVTSMAHDVTTQAANNIHTLPR